MRSELWGEQSPEKENQSPGKENQRAVQESRNRLRARHCGEFGLGIGEGTGGLVGQEGGFWMRMKNSERDKGMWKLGGCQSSADEKTGKRMQAWRGDIFYQDPSCHSERAADFKSAELSGLTAADPITLPWTGNCKGPAAWVPRSRIVYSRQCPFSSPHRARSASVPEGRQGG